MLNRSFWQYRRVFITGHTGFKGSWLSLWLDAMGAHVTGYALAPPTEPSLFERARIGECIHSIHGDVRDFAGLKSAIAECDPEVIIHMAAQSVVRSGYEEPVGTYATNVMGTVHLLEAVRQLKRPCVVLNVTSDKCYANQEWVWGYRESDPMGGHDPYSNSKGCAELVTSAYRDSYFSANAMSLSGVALASARAGNAIGGGDWTANQLIPDLIRAFMDRRPCRIRNPAGDTAMAVPAGAAAWLSPAVREACRGRFALRLGMEFRSGSVGRKAGIVDRRYADSVVGRGCLLDARRRETPSRSPTAATGHVQVNGRSRMATGVASGAGPRVDRRVVSGVPRRRRCPGRHAPADRALRASSTRSG